MTSKEILARAEAIYDKQIRPRVEPDYHGKFIAIDANSGDYEVGDDHLALTRAVRARHPDALLATLRIGYPAVGRIGFRAPAPEA